MYMNYMKMEEEYWKKRKQEDFLWIVVFMVLGGAITALLAIAFS